MNTNESSSLIDESEIRAALSFLSIDREDFGHGVRERVRVRQSLNQTVGRPAGADDANRKDRGGLLRIAASVLPVNLLGANTAVSQTSLAAMGVFQKAIAFLALPAISFLMIAVTIGSWYRIRVAQKSQSLPDADLSQMQESVNGWWRRHGWIAAIVFVLTLASPFFGWTTPLLFLFMASAIGTASIVTTLGRAGLVDRSAIGGYCIAMLGLLGQVSMASAMTNNTQLLDPHLVTVTFFAGIVFLLFFVNPFARFPGRDVKPKKSGSDETRQRLLGGGFIQRGFNRWPSTQIVVRSMALIFIASATAYFSQTLWRPIGTSTLVQHVETFEPELVGGWSYWQSTARWLQDQGISYDHSAVQARWLEDLNEEESNRSYLLNHAVSTGLKYPPKRIQTKEFRSKEQRLLSTGTAGIQISSVSQHEYIIDALVEQGSLTNEQRDHLAGRLMETWRSLNDHRIQESLVSATVITNLLSLIDRPLAEAERKADVRRWLAEYQVTESRRFTRSGGFKRYSKSDSSDLLATDHAVRLMQHYGIHDSVDVLALRAFLRPASTDRQLMMTASVRASARQRLDQIPGISNPNLWDYIHLHQSLWFAMLLVGLCVYTTLGSPQIMKKT